MTTKTTIVRLAALAGMAIGLTACGLTPPPHAQTWTGTTTFGATAHPLHIDVVLRGTDWTGRYTIGSTPPFTGDVVAELIDGTLTGELQATATCTYTLAGTITHDALDATFTPTACPGGEGGTWTATPAVADE